MKRALYGALVAFAPLLLATVGIWSVAHAAAGDDDFAACRPARVVVADPSRPGQDITAVAYPSGPSSLRTLEHLIEAKATQVPVLISKQGTTAGLTPVQTTISSRDGYIDFAELKAADPGEALTACVVSADAPVIGSSVSVLSFSVAMDGKVHSHPALITDYRAKPQIFAERAMILNYSEESPEIVAGSLVMSAGKLVGIVRDATDPTLAMVAADIAPAASLPGHARVTMLGQTGDIAYGALEFRAADQTGPAKGNFGGYVVARVKAEAREAFAANLGAKENNALYIESFNDQHVQDIPSLLRLLARCPADPAPACAPSAAWGTFLSEDDAKGSIAQALVALNNLRYAVEVQAKGIPAPLRDRAVEKLARLSDLLRDLNAKAAADRVKPEFKTQAREPLKFWKNEIDPFGGGMLFELSQAIGGSLGNFEAYGTAVRRKLQQIVNAP